MIKQYEMVMVVMVMVMVLYAKHSDRSYTQTQHHSFWLDYDDDVLFVG